MTPNCQFSELWNPTENNIMVRFLWSRRIYFLLSPPIRILLPQTWISCLLCIRDCGGNKITMIASCVAYNMFRKINLWTDHGVPPQELNKKPTRNEGAPKGKICDPSWGSQTKLGRLGDSCSIPQRINSYLLNTLRNAKLHSDQELRKVMNVIWQEIF